ncbi:MAG: glycoside hydrolase N-terminal domain-containing protein [Eubacteriales bacterium]|nr:glycoside hydrolase N-terminal domain-containing protein [Eubacteriales bacterium]
MRICRKSPAKRWGEAFAIGNGQMGGMVYGGIEKERIDLSENTFFSGNASDRNNQPHAAEAFSRMREEAAREDFGAVHETAKEFIGVRGNYGTNLPVGSLVIETGLSGEMAENYERSLDIRKGVVEACWDYQGGKVRSRAFASHVHKVLYYEMSGEGVTFSFRMRFESPRDGEYVNYNIGGLYFECEAKESMHSDGTTGTLLIGKAAVHTDGFPKAAGDGLEIRNASRVAVYVMMETDFEKEKGVGVKAEAAETVPAATEGLREKAEMGAGAASAAPAEKLRDAAASEASDAVTGASAAETVPESEEAVHTAESAELLRELTGGMESGRLGKIHKMQMEMNRKLVAFEGLPAEQLLEEHTADMEALADRVTLEIEGEGHAAQIPEMFQMGRYLLYSASREDSALPAHLQGVWNDNVACRIGWTCDMHLDINTQMNYWPAEVTNLPETTKPLFSWIRDSLAVNGRQTARESYGLKGWVAELVSNSWGFAAPYWASPIAPCPTGGVWILTHMWEHYLSTQDRKFLSKEAYPLIEEAVEFFEGYLFEDENGNLTCGPSISPENTFVGADGKGYQISNGCTYEILMIRELFQIYLEASEILHKEKKLTEKVRMDLKRLLPYRITEDGRIAEWSHGYPAADPQHRHTSHLLGVFPFAQITPENRKLAKAAETTIQAKLTPEENWEDTGWARSMLMLYEARLRHPDQAWRHICAMLDKLLEPNGFIIHPPTRGAGSFDNVYELDGNTGFTSCIAEMLMQSHNGVIRLLPCLPKEWKSGHVKGLVARGGVQVEIEWKGKECCAWLTAKKSGTYVAAKGREKKEVTLRAGRRTKVWG